MGESLRDSHRVRRGGRGHTAAVWAAGCVVVALAQVAAAEDAPSFNRDIRPILANSCFVCHGPDSGTREAELRLDTEEGATEWAIVAGDAEGSEVIARVTSDDPEVRMPPAKSKKPPLTPEQIELLRKWINAGAEYEPHWAYIPPERPPVPEVRVAASAAADADASLRHGESSIGETRPLDWPRNDIDRFLLARMESRGIGPSPEADRVTLIRRLYFDLIGLPPTPAEIDEFVADTRPDAYEQLVERLLASPAFGERMATWWFDLVRFATTVGYHGDQDQRITPYRDYVIKAFNDNMPFSQFTIEQLAGDLLPNPTMWQLVATGYNRVLQTTHEGGAQDAEYRAIYLADRVRNFSETWMAGSVGCAQCHDHKFDPYTQEEFYSLAAFFADVDEYGSFSSVGGNELPTERPPEMLAWTLPIYERMQKVDARIAELEAALVGLLDNDWEKRRAEMIQLKKERLDLEAQFVPTMVTRAVEPREIRVLPRGNWMDKSGPVVQPHTPQFMRQLDTGDRRANRLDLAKWLVSRDHPLTARVVVNRLWKIYYGVGLSKVLIDMGSRGEAPQNQELLDWLAIEFMDSGWDMKHMIRLMVTSSAYRQSSVPRPEVDTLDPDNRLAARQSRFRLQAEEIRDNALAVSGLLVNKLGGEIVKPYQPAKYYSALNFPEREYTPSSGDDQFRRAVYVHWQRQFLHPALLAFDAPTREECTADRPISSTPTAALVLLNDPSFVEAAKALAAKILTNNDMNDDNQRIHWAWRQVLGREAQSEEAAQLAELLHKHRAEYTADPKAAEALVSVGISAKPKDLNVTDLAAWTSVSRVLLNLNETITRN
ncbi:MAG: PSD1 and planctomycete cytochrome C domain-containing protein [Planctomycetes bacterium]|nr:PSD1 and planctomycete cytochrome C domain-containing protein [Planctomycetota bacterium]